MGLPAILLLLLFFPTSLVAAPEATRDQEAIELFESLFPRHRVHAGQLSAAHGHCLTLALSTLQAFLSSNPISPAVKASILSILDEPAKPDLPKTIETAHLTIRYTDSPLDLTHQVSAETLQALVNDLDAYYEKFLQTFGKVDPAPPAKLSIDVYDFQMSPGYEGALGFTTQASAVISVAPSVINDPCVARRTLAHELFHRVQFAHGLFRPGSPVSNDESYWIEGMAEWAVTHVIPGDNGFLDYVKPVFDVPAIPVFRRSYDATLFWIYLDERQREAKGAKKAGKIIDLILNKYDAGTATSMRAIVADALRGLQRQGKGGAVAGVPPDALLMQDFHLSILYDALGIGTKKLGFDPYHQSSDACGQVRGFPRLVPHGGLQFTSDEDLSFFDQSTDASYGGVALYLFINQPAVTRTNIEVETPLDYRVVVTVVGMSQNTRKSVRTTGKSPHRHKLKFPPGTLDRVFVLVGGVRHPDDRIDNLFAITVNGGILAGRWQFPDKNPVEIVDVGDGRFLGEYRGTAGSGHPNLMGRFFGAFDGARWTGDFTIDEEAVAVTGTFALDYAPGPPETLAGTITAHSNLDPVDRTNPITLTRAKSKRR